MQFTMTIVLALSSGTQIDAITIVVELKKQFPATFSEIP